MANTFKDLWTDKFAPTNLEEMVLNQETKAIFSNFINTKSLTNFSMIGAQGCGKTSLARLLANELDSDYLFIPCALEGGVDTIRNKISQFVSAYSEKIKIVILDEIDSASADQKSSFQKSLRNLIDMNQDTRFICTANYNNVIPAILSRCPKIDIRFSTKDILKRIIEILKCEKISYSKNDLEQIVKIINKQFPDIRSIINYAQQHVIDSKLNFSKNIALISDSNEIINNIISNIKNNISIIDIRKEYISKNGKHHDYLNLGSELFEFILDNNLINDSAYLRKITQAIYELNMCIDKEIAFFGIVCIIHHFMNKG